MAAVSGRAGDGASECLYAVWRTLKALCGAFAAGRQPWWSNPGFTTKHGADRTARSVVHPVRSRLAPRRLKTSVSSMAER